MSAPDSEHDVKLERLAEEFVERQRKGERPSLAAYAERYPELADDIRDLFPALVQIEKLKPADDVSSASAATPSAEHAVPKRLGDYRILREVGRGGMGVVYEAEQESLGRHVALKLLPSPALLKSTYLERFRREAKAAGRLHHTNIVPVFGVGEHDGVPFYVMQFIHGEGLDKVLADIRHLRRLPQGAAPATEGSVAHSLVTGFTPPVVGPGPPHASSAASSSASGISRLSAAGSEADYYRGVVRVGVQVADALVYAHAQGILHRDIKPSNLLLELRGTVWITDFGLAKAEGTEELSFEGKSLPQSDIYGLGLTLYELLTLQPAFDHTNKGKLIDLVLHEPPVSPRMIDPRVPRDLETIVLKCLAKDPKDRYATAEALAEDLRRFLTDRPIHARRSTATEKSWRWCRRNRLVATMMATVVGLLTVIAVGGIVMSLHLQWALETARVKQAEVETAERAGREQLLEARMGQARARRYSGRKGQRFRSLEAIRQATALARQLEKPPDTFDELRNEAIAALCLPDIYAGGPEWKSACPSSEIGFDSTGERYVQVDGNGHAYYCRLVDGKEARLKEFEVSGTPVRGEWHSPDLCFLLLGSPAVEGGGHEWVKLWRCDGPKAKLIELEGGGGSYRESTTFSADGRFLAIAKEDRTLTVYDTETGAKVRRWLVDVPAIRARFHPHLLRVAIISHPEIRIYDVASGALLPNRFTHQAGLSDLGWHPDGRRMAIACIGRGIALWDSETGRELTPRWQGLTANGVHVRFNKTGDRVLSTDWSGILRLWDAGTGKQLFNMPGISWVNQPACCRDDQCLVQRQAGDTIGLLQFAPGREYQVLPANTPGREQQGCDHLRHPRGWMLSADFPVDGRFGFDASGALLSRNANGVFRWPVRVKAPGGPHHLGPPERLTGERTLLDGVFSSSRDGRVQAFARVTHATVIIRGPPYRTFTLGPQFDLRDVSVSPDGHWVATGSHWAAPDGENTKIWEAATGKLVTVLPIANSAAPSFSSDGRWLHALWGDSGHWHEVGTWKPRAVSCPPGALSPDGRLLACSAGFGEVKLVDFETGKEIARLGIPDQTRLFPAYFSPDGTLLFATGSETGYLYRWDLRLIRRQLAKLDLDLELPPLQGEGPPQATWPLPTVVVHHPELANDAAKLRQWELTQAAVAWHANPFDADVHARLGALAFADGRWREAFAHLSIARALRPEDFEVRRQRAMAARHCAQWAQAVADATWVLRQTPGHLHALWARVESLQRLGRHAEAVDDLTACLRFRPTNWTLYVQRARCREALNDAPQAIADCVRAIALLPRTVHPWSDRNRLCGLLAKREDWFAKAVELRPKEAGLWLARGRYFARKSAWSKAAAAYTKATAVPDDHDHHDLFEQACVQLLAGDVPGYQATCAKMRELFGRTDDPQTAYLVARTCVLHEGSEAVLADARKLAEKALAGKVTNDFRAATLHVLGLVQFRSGDYEGAVRRLNQSLATTPKWIGAPLNWPALALAHDRLGHVDEARKWLDMSSRRLDEIAQEIARTPTGFPEKVHPADWLELQVLQRETAAVLSAAREARPSTGR